MMSVSRSSWHSSRHHGPDHVLGHVDDPQRVDAGAPAELVGDRRRTPRAGCCRRRRRSGGREPSTWSRPPRAAMTVLATPRPRFSWAWKPTCASCPSSATSAATRSAVSLEDQRAGGVDDVDALAAGVDHDPRLPGEHLGRLACGPSSGSRRSPGRARGPAPKCWSAMSASVQWVAIRADRTRRGRAPRRMSSLVPMPGQQQHGDLRALRRLGRRRDQLLLVVREKP